MKEDQMSAESGSVTVGFVGTGVMGRSMAGHLLAAGYPLHVYTRTKGKADELVARGAIWHDSVADLAASCNLLITVVGFPSDVEHVYLGPGGIVANAPEGALLIDMTTSSPALAVRISQEANRRGLEALDAPVSGGDTGAREARLAIMAGGSRAAFDRALPVLQVMGKSIVYQGPAGSGQHTKMANQIAIAAGMLGVCEALAYAKRAGLDQETVLASISGGAAGSWSLSNLGPRMISGNFGPGFYVKHFVKDMKIALESARSFALDTPGLSLARQMYERLAETDGGGELGTQGLYRLYDR